MKRHLLTFAPSLPMTTIGVGIDSRVTDRQMWLGGTR